jgi:hypothetical protein
MVRKGLLRCWNCGAFMDATTQARYQALQANPAPTVFSQVPEEEMVAVDAADDDDFELSTQESAAAVVKTDLSRLDAAAPAAEARPAPADAGPATAHSVATGGDVLLQVALLQEAESKLRRRRRPQLTGGAKTPGGFIIFCPYGCRIEVKEQHRGMSGRCPRCKAPFTVPVAPPDYSAAVKKKGADADRAEAGAATPGGFKYWLEDLHVHTVPPEKLKLKADSLTKDFAEADFGFSPEGMLVVSLAKKGGGLFGSGGGDKKKAETRTAMLQHLQEAKPRGELPVGEQQLVSPDQLRQMRVVQPAASRAASMFHGVPVFGAGRIAVLMPATDENAPPRYVSLGINQFRRMAQALAELYGIENFGADCGVPIEDEFEDAGKCHYLGVPVRGIKNVEFYRADPTCEVVVAGWKCAGCGLVISEDAREKEKLGGKGGKGLAKVKCPKCQQKFGEQPIHSLKQTASHPTMAGEEPLPSTAADAAKPS